MTTHVPVGTSLLTVNVSNRSAADSAALANAIASQLTSYVLPGADPSKAGLQVELTVVDPAVAPADRDGPGLPIRIALGAAIALFLTLSVVFLSRTSGPRTNRQAEARPGDDDAARPVRTNAAREPSRRPARSQERRLEHDRDRPPWWIGHSPGGGLRTGCRPRHRIGEVQAA